MAEQPGNQTHTMALAKDKAKLAVAAVKGDDAQVCRVCYLTHGTRLRVFTCFI
jgi:hypothetical protein